MLAQEIPTPKIIEYSVMQMEFQENCYDDPMMDHRWNGKIGATRSGKTTLDYMWTIPFRLATRQGLKGACCITGVSLGTIGRNVLEPMRDYWKAMKLPKVVGETRTDRDGNKYCMIFGEKVYLIGMEKINAVAKLRGAEFKYVYCDELAECNEDAFILLKSRLSLPYSCCDFTCNPESDTHWLYYFINSNIDIYVQKYTIFDNPFLSKKFVDDLCAEYSGTVYYDRYILGLWKKAEGIIYRPLADNPKDFILYEVPRLSRVVLGVDFGGNGSAHTFVATGYGFNLDFMVILESRRIEATGLDPNDLNNAFEDFVKMIKTKYKVGAMDCYCDSAEQTLINGLKSRVAAHNLGVIIHNALKREIKDRIKLIIRMLGAKKLYWMFTAQTSINAMSTCVYNSKEGHQDERLDDGSTDIDSVDATEYTIEPEMFNLLALMETRPVSRLRGVRI